MMRAALLWLCAAAAFGQQRHTHETGFSFPLPAGWTVKDNLQGSFLLPPGVKFDPDRTDNTEVYMASIEEGYEPAEEAKLARELSEVFLSAGVRLARAGDREPFPGGAAYIWEFRHPDTGMPYGLHICVSGKAGRALVAIAFGESGRIERQAASMRQVAAAMAYQPPRPAAAGPLADDTPLARQWLAKLRGKVIKQFLGAGSGMTGEKTRYLAPDGTYTMSGNTVIAIDVGPYGGAPTASASSIGRQQATGRWRIRDDNGRAFLEVRTADGQRLLLALTADQRNWYLNGEKAFAVDP